MRSRSPIVPTTFICSCCRKSKKVFDCCRRFSEGFCCSLVRAERSIRAVTFGRMSTLPDPKMSLNSPLFTFSSGTIRLAVPDLAELADFFRK